MFRELANEAGVALALEGFASLAAAEGQAERALRLAGAVAARRATIGAARPPHMALELDGWLEQSRQSLSPARAAAAWTDGQTMRLEQSIAYALEGAN